MSNAVTIVINAIDNASATIKKVGSNINTSMTNAGKGLDKFAGGINEGVKQMTGFNLSTLVGVGGVALLARGMVDAVRDTMDYAKAVRDVARYTGTSAEESSKFLQIADDLQIETATLKVGFRNLNNEGIQPTIENVKGLAEKYQALKSPVDKAKFAMEMFGARSGMEMAKMLELTTEQIDEMAQSAEDLGLVLSEDTIQATEDYRLSVDQLNDSWMGLKTTIATAAIPVLTDVTEGMNGYIERTLDLKKAQELGLVTEEEVYLAKRGAIDINTILADRLDEINQKGGTDTEAAFARGQMALKEYGTTAGEVTLIVDALATSEDILSKALDKSATSAYEAARMAVDEAAAKGELNKESLDQNLAELQLIKNAETLAQAYLDKKVSYMDYIRAKADDIVTTEELNDAMGDTPTHLSDIQTATGIAAEKWGEYETKSLAAVRDTAPELTTAEGLIRGIIAAWEGIPSYMSTVYDIFVKTHGGGIFEGDVFGDKGGVPYVQYGGPVSANRPYIVGEAGPEMFVPNTPGRIVPNNQLGGMGGGGGIVIHNHSAGAAALSWAMVKSHQKRRLQRGMGG